MECVNHREADESENYNLDWEEKKKNPKYMCILWDKQQSKHIHHYFPKSIFLVLKQHNLLFF